MQAALEARQIHVERTNETFHQLRRETQQNEVQPPEAVQQKINKLNADWVKINQDASNLRPLSGSSSEALMVEGRI